MAGAILAYIATVCSVVGTVVGLITLLTVYLAAVQLITQRRVYLLGLSETSLGPWNDKVASSIGLKFMQTEIMTPRVSLARLVRLNREAKWEPRITFPTGWTRVGRDVEAGSVSEQVLAETSWVNFLQALSITPNDNLLYEMRFESELVNGIVPMRWKGKDLVGICCVLGFQSYEDDPSFKTPMPLPMQWSGPLGFLQFRASSEGCIAEFRRRLALPPQLSKDVFSYFNEHPIESRPLRLDVRLWHSVDGLPLKHNCTLYLGGANRKRGSEQSQQQASTAPQTAAVTTVKDDGLVRVWLPKRVELLSKSPGLLSKIVEGEFANGWGLNFTSGCHEYIRRYIDYDDYEGINQTAYPFRIGTLCMNKELLRLVREAVMELKPDGYYFTPGRKVSDDVDEFYRHVDQQSDELNEVTLDGVNYLIFPNSNFNEWSELGPEWIPLYHAMALCNDFQRIKKTSGVHFTVDDMRIVSKATQCLHQTLDREIDLTWAFIISPELFAETVKRYRRMTVNEVSEFSMESRDETIRLPAGSSGNTFAVPLLADATFSSLQVLAAFLDVFLTYFWIDLAWISDVRAYDPTIPHSVTMC